MADLKLLSILGEGVAVWNQWRAEHRNVLVDLTEANLRAADLRGVDLRKVYLGRANLSEANLREANFNGSNLNWADLREADLRKGSLCGADVRGASMGGLNLSDANLARANLTGVDLSGLNLAGAVLAGALLRDADLRQANLRDADLHEAKLTQANLREVRLNGARLDEADLSETNLRGADLRDANLTGADLRSARLQAATLDRATLTGVQLWESQRGGWSIKKVVCGSAYWDEKSVEAVRYESGEFERLYSAQARVELVYLGGITTFEVNTLPALLHHLATQYPDCGVRLKSIEETGGGVRVSLHVDETDAGTLDAIRVEAQRTQAAQIALRDDQIARLEIQKRLLLDDVLPRMLAAAGQQVQITGSATNVVIAGGQATVRAEQKVENSEALLELLREVLARRGELAAGQAEKLDGAVQAVEGELEASKPRASVIAAGLGVVKEIAVKVVESATEKAVLEHWQPLVHQLTHYLAQMVH